VPGVEEERRTPSVSSDSDVEAYTKFSPDLVPRMARSRLERLLGRLHHEQRDQVLKEVGIWLDSRLGEAQKEEARLIRLDKDCSRESADAVQNAGFLLERLQSREVGPTGPVGEFFKELSEAQAKLQEERHEKHTPTAGTLDVRHGKNMTDEEIEAAIEATQREIEVVEVEAWRDLCELNASELGGQDHPEKPPSDIIDQQQQMLVYMRESISTNERRAKSIKEAMDQLGGRKNTVTTAVTVGDVASTIIEEIRQEVKDTVVPELLTWREQTHGEDLKLPPEDYLQRIRDECQQLQRKTSAAVDVLSLFAADDAFAEDMAAQLVAIEEGELPQQTLLHSGLAAVDQLVEEDSATSEGPSSRRSGSISLGSPPARLHSMRRSALHVEGEEDTEADAMAGMRVEAKEEEVRREVQRCLDDQRKLQYEVLQASRALRSSRQELAQVSAHEAEVRDNIDLLDSNTKLFSSTVDIMRGQCMTDAEIDRQSQRGQAPNTNEATGAATVAAVVGLGGRGKSSAQETQSWAAAFLACDNETYDKESNLVQREVLKALADEEKHLATECRELEDSMQQRARQFFEMQRLGQCGLNEKSAQHLRACIEEGRNSLEDFNTALQTTSELGQPRPITPASYNKADFEMRLAMVRHVRASLSSGVPAPEGEEVQDWKSPEMEEAVLLQQTHQEIVERSATLSQEIAVRRRHGHGEADTKATRRSKKPLRRKSKTEIEAADDARSFRQKIRALQAARKQLLLLKARSETDRETCKEKEDAGAAMEADGAAGATGDAGTEAVS